jgi:hypothetical protein
VQASLRNQAQTHQLHWSLLMNLSYLLTVLIWGTTWIARNATGRGGNRRVHRLSLLPWRHWCCLLCCCSAIACKLDKLTS